MAPTILALILAFAAGVIITPLMRRIARRIGLVDQPDGQRKLHGGGVSLGGGLAVLTAWLLTLALLAFGSTSDVAHPLASIGQNPWASMSRENVGLLASAILICLIGLADDRWRLRGRQKLAGQLVAVTIVMASGVLIQQVRIFDFRVDLGLLAIPFTAFWLLGAVNALNLIDGADGMASTVGAIICGTMATLATMNGNVGEAMVAAALCGAILAFLIFNFPPASIFLGDAGSMLIGLVVGILAIRTSLKGAATVALVTPLALLTIPIFDSLAAILRRRLTGRSIYTTDRGHLHHCLLRCGLTHSGMLLCVACLTLLTAAGALFSVYLHNEMVALVSVAMVVTVLVSTRVFGFAELSLLAHRVFAFGGSLWPVLKVQRGPIRQSTVRLQGSRQWEQVWATLTEFAEAHALCHVNLDVNVSWLHEGYHAVWERREMPDESEMWSTRIPIVARGRTIGRLEVSGVLARESLYVVLNMLAELLDSLEPSFERLAAVEQPGDAGAAQSASSAQSIPAPKFADRRTGLDDAEEGSASLGMPAATEK